MPLSQMLPLLRRKDALRSGKVRYFTGKPCKRGHIAERIARCGRCMQCCKEHYYGDNREKHAKYVKNWVRRHPHWGAEIQAWLKAKELNRIPGWVNQGMRDKIRSVYAKAEEAERISGIPLEVDHIIPFHGEAVWGLHVPWNLQILTRTQNRSKGTRLRGMLYAFGE